MDALHNIAYYVTGHGLGHATRSLELMGGLLKTKKFRVVSISNVPQSFFVQEFKASNIPLHDDHGHELYSHCSRNLDTGGIQLDVIRMDTLGTLEAYVNTIHKHRESMLEQEVAWLKSNNISLILLDATPLGSIAGKMAGIPAVFVSNFTWDYIFREMLEILRHSTLDAAVSGAYDEMVEQCAFDVCSCSAAIRYPGATPLPTRFNSKVISGPLISRMIRNDKLREQLNLPDGVKLLLLGFGGHTVDWNLQDCFLPAGWHCIVLRANAKLMPSDRFTVAKDDCYVPDYIFAADVVLGKIGYGFVSECLSAGTPLVYVPRIHWPEEAHMEHLLTVEYDAGVSIPLEEYEQGNWNSYLDQALSKKGTWNSNNSTATEQVVSILEKMLSN